MDYTILALENCVIFNKEFGRVLFEAMDAEADFIQTAISTGVIVKEEAEKLEASTKNTKTLWERIKEFFARIFGVFEEKVKKMVESNREWLDKHFKELEGLDYSDLKIEMVPYWNITSINDLKSTISNVVNKTFLMALNKDQYSKYTDRESIEKGLFGEFREDSTGSLRDGALNYFKTKNANGPIKPVELEGDTLKKQVIGDMRNFCYNYQKDVVPFVKNISDGLVNKLKSVESEINRRPANESVSILSEFSLLEGTIFGLTELATIPYGEYVIATEADEPAKDAPKQEEKKPEEKPDDAAKHPTKVALTDKRDKDQAQADADKEQYKDKSTDQLKFLKDILQCNQILVTACMTSMEERYLAYINAMKQIYTARHSK